MIYIDLNGRCGDQFFQYAFARKIQIYLKNNEPLQLNFFNQERWKSKINDDSFRNDLSRFHIVDHNAFINNTQNIFNFGSKKQVRILKHYNFLRKVSQKLSIKSIAKNYHKKMQRNGIFYEDSYFSFLCYPKTNINVFLKGYFEDFHFYEDENLKSLLVEELTPIVSNANSNPLFEQIKQCESVCVSMRSWKEVAQFKEVVKSRFICDKVYFETAMKELLPSCQFFIFTDDLDFARANIDMSFSPIFENEGNSIEDKITLMSSCKHFIISNSSFSWWTQYLSGQDGSTTISPNRWYTDKEDIRIINTNWIRI